VHDIPGIERLRYTTSHPREMTPRVVEAYARLPKLVSHLHLPVQAGSDRVLAAMKRGYTVLEYKSLVRKLRAARPDLSLSSDFIVGFPGETEAQFEATLRLLEQVRYDTVFAAAFSPRPGTPAERLVDDVPPAEKRRRLNTLLALQEGVGLERNRGWLGRTTEVLVESVTPPRSHDHDEAARMAPQVPGHVALSGRNREHRLVHFTGPAELVGQFVDVHIDHAGPYALRGVAA